MKSASDDVLADPDVRAAAESVYDYARMNHSLDRDDGKPWDGVLCLCSSDLRVAAHAAALHESIGGSAWLCFSGGMGTGPHSGANLLGWTEPEAVVFAREAVRCGAAESSIIVEDRAANTGENVAFSRALLAEKGLPCERVIIVQKPFMERRSWATLKKVWPESDAVISSPALDLDECVAGGAIDGGTLLSHMVGDLQRIRLYALPDRNFQIAQPIPEAVWQAYETLVAKGFIENVLPCDEEKVLQWDPSWLDVADG